MKWPKCCTQTDAACIGGWNGLPPPGDVEAPGMGGREGLCPNGTRIATACWKRRWRERSRNWVTRPIGGPCPCSKLSWRFATRSLRSPRPRCGDASELVGTELASPPTGCAEESRRPKFSIVRRICNWTPNHLVARLAQETNGEQDAPT